MSKGQNHISCTDCTLHDTSSSLGAAKQLIIVGSPDMYHAVMDSMLALNVDFLMPGHKQVKSDLSKPQLGARSQPQEANMV